MYMRYEMGKYLGNLFKKVPSIIYETSLDGSIVKKVFDPNGTEIKEDVAEFHHSDGGLFSFLSSLFPVKTLKDNGREYNEEAGSFEYPPQGGVETRSIWERLGAKEGDQLSDGGINMD
jgi:hypothetical protein